MEWNRRWRLVQNVVSKWKKAHRNARACTHVAVVVIVCVVATIVAPPSLIPTFLARAPRAPDFRSGSGSDATRSDGGNERDAAAVPSVLIKRGFNEPTYTVPLLVKARDQCFDRMSFFSWKDMKRAHESGPLSK